jgi:hypothetical protein
MIMPPHSCFHYEKRNIWLTSLRVPQNASESSQDTEI